MTNETPSPITPYDFDNDPDGFTKADFRDHDPLLDLLLGVVPGASDSQAAIGITVTINGAVLSGLAVSFAHWQQLWTQALREASESLGEGFAAVVPTMVQERADLVARREAEDRPTPTSKYLHLKDAEIVTGGYRRRVGLMRLRLAQVDAWALGQSID